MSADNGIYVLLTESGKGPEYRVVYSHAIDNIYGKWNNETAKYDGNIHALQETFKEAPVFHTINEALDYAEEVENKIGNTEDGICIINEFAHHGYIFD